MELYGRGQPRQYIERFTPLLSEGPVGWGRPGGAEGGGQEREEGVRRGPGRGSIAHALIGL